MMTRRSHCLPLLTLLIIGLLIGPAVTSGYVWCVTPDGHHALEAAIAGDCSVDDCAQPAENPATATVSAATDSCGPCLDVSTAHHWGNTRSRQGDLPVTLLAGITLQAVVATATLPEWTLNRHRVVDFSPRISEPILLHRTTVLLI